MYFERVEMVAEGWELRASSAMNFHNAEIFVFRLKARVKGRRDFP